MFSHVMIGTNDLDKAKSFYDALLGTLGVQPGRVDRHRIFYRTKTGVFSVSLPIDGKPATHANGGTIGFSADSAEQADAWHATGIANGAMSVASAASARNSVPANAWRRWRCACCIRCCRDAGGSTRPRTSRNAWWMPPCRRGRASTWSHPTH